MPRGRCDLRHWRPSVRSDGRGETYGGSVPAAVWRKWLALAGSPKDSVASEVVWEAVDRPERAIAALGKRACTGPSVGPHRRDRHEHCGPLPDGDQDAASKCGDDEWLLRASVDADAQRAVGLGCEQFRSSLFQEADPCETFHERRLLRSRDKWLSRRRCMTSRSRQIGARRHSTFAPAVVCYIAARWLLPQAMCLGNGATFSSWSALAPPHSRDWSLLPSRSI